MAGAQTQVPSPAEPLTVRDPHDGQYIINPVWFRFFNDILANIVIGNFNGDVSGIAPTLSVIKINGVNLGLTTATAGNLLIGSSSSWVTQAISGDATLSSGGALTLANSVSTRSNLGLGSIATQSANNISVTGGTASGLTITGGTASGLTIDNAPIGNITQNTAKFTTASSEIGTSANFVNQGGTANSNVNSVSNTGTSETVLMSYTLPANALVNNGDYVEIIAWGTTATNANNKTIRLKFGSTYLLQSNTASASGVSWMFRAIVSKTGSATETALAEMQSSATFTNTVNVTSPTESTTASIIIEATGQSGTASNDITQTGMVVQWFPNA